MWRAYTLASVALNVQAGWWEVWSGVEKKPKTITLAQAAAATSGAKSIPPAGTPGPPPGPPPPQEAAASGVAA